MVYVWNGSNTAISLNQDTVVPIQTSLSNWISCIKTTFWKYIPHGHWEGWGWTRFQGNVKSSSSSSCYWHVDGIMIGSSEWEQDYFWRSNTNSTVDWGMQKEQITRYTRKRAIGKWWMMMMMIGVYDLSQANDPLLVLRVFRSCYNAHDWTYGRLWTCGGTWNTRRS